MIFQDSLNWLACVFFLALWVGYTLYVKEAAKKRDCLSALLYTYRVEWVRNMLHRENRITDVALQSNLSQLVNFLASTTILVIAGLLTVLNSADHLVELLAKYSFIAETSVEEVQFKLLILVGIFIFAFFKFTWSMRQHSFYTILMGGLPYIENRALTAGEEEFAVMTAKISDRAGHEFNYGLRSYYFALAFLTWFVSPWLFMATCLAVVAILYYREFKSVTLSYLVRSRKAVDIQFTK